MVAPRGPGWAAQPPQSITLGFFQARLGFLASPPGKMFFVPILLGPEGEGVGLQGGGAGREVGRGGRGSLIKSLVLPFQASALPNPSAKNQMGEPPHPTPTQLDAWERGRLAFRW